MKTLAITQVAPSTCVHPLAARRAVGCIAILLGLVATPVGAADDPATPPASGPATTAPIQSSDDEPMRVIEVTGLRAVPWKSYSAMVAAEKAYNTHKSTLAPQAQFLFAVLAPEGQKLAPNFALRVRLNSGREVPITFVRGRMFKLPVLAKPDPEAELVSNHKGGRLRIGLHLRTPGVPMDMIRLGDQRLSCHVNEALDADERSWLVRLIVSDRCNSAKASHTQAPYGNLETLGAKVREGDREAPLPAFKLEGSDHLHYGLPLADKSWGNDALIVFDYKVPPPRRSPEHMVLFRSSGIKSQRLPTAPTSVE